MSTPLPFWRVVAEDGPWATVEIDLPDFHKAVITMAKRAVGTPAGDAAIRQVIDGRESTKDFLREGP